MLGELHSATVPACIRSWSPYTAPSSALTAALSDADTSWDSGPLGEPARNLVRANRGDIDRLFQHVEQLSTRLSSDDDAWVVSHGEPHSGNVIRTSAGNLLLIDWDTARLAPRERDLVELLDPPTWRAYISSAGDVQARPYVLELFRAEWDLCEIDCYVTRLHQSHTGSADDHDAITELAEYLDIDQRWPHIG